MSRRRWLDGSESSAVVEGEELAAAEETAATPTIIAEERLSLCLVAMRCTEDIRSYGEETERGDSSVRCWRTRPIGSDSGALNTELAAIPDSRVLGVRVAEVMEEEDHVLDVEVHGQEDVETLEVEDVVEIGPNEYNGLDMNEAKLAELAEIRVPELVRDKDLGLGRTEDPEPAR